MSEKMVIFLTHGMGNIPASEFDERVRKLSDSLRKRLGNDKYNQLIFKKVHFSDILQVNQEEVYGEMNRASELDWKRLRRFVLYYLSDPVSLEHRAQEPDSVYHKTQSVIFNTLREAYSELEAGEKKAVFLAQSLGCQVISNYIWDSQSNNPQQGIWMDQHNLPVDEESFVRLKALKAFVTTGCNIPIFVAGKSPIQAVQSNSGGYGFEWHNFYDKDDILGWPLKPMGKFHDPGQHGASYDEAVTEDHLINAKKSFLGALTRSWNPLCHYDYWETRKFINFFSGKIKQILNS